MTLLIGVLCTDGVVIASDRQATHGGMGVMTVGQPVTKASIIGDNALFATSGHHGLGQQLEGAVTKLHATFATGTYHERITTVQNAFRQIIIPALNTAAAAGHVFGPQVAMQDAMCGCLLAATFQDGMKLIEFTPQAAVEFMTPELPFISMGSGKATADPFLGFLMSVFWPSKVPSVIDGTLVAYWTVQHAIDMKVLGVGFEPDVFRIEFQDGRAKAKKLDSDDLGEHREFIAAAKKELGALRQRITNEPALGALGGQEPPKLPNP